MNRIDEFNNKHKTNLTQLDFVFLYTAFKSNISEEIEFLKLLHNNLKLDNEFKEYLVYLQDNNLIKILNYDTLEFSIKPLGKNFIGIKDESDIIILAEKLREIYPKGVTSGGYPVRSSLPDVVNKLKKFKKKYNYSKEEIIEATQNYVNKKRMDNYSYMQILSYFIEKNGISTLASEIDNMRESFKLSDMQDNNIERL